MMMMMMMMRRRRRRREGGKEINLRIDGSCVSGSSHAFPPRLSQSNHDRVIITTTTTTTTTTASTTTTTTTTTITSSTLITTIIIITTTTTTAYQPYLSISAMSCVPVLWWVPTILRKESAEERDICWRRRGVEVVGSERRRRRRRETRNVQW